MAALGEYGALFFLTTLTIEFIVWIGWANRRIIEDEPSILGKRMLGCLLIIVALAALLGLVASLLLVLYANYLI